MELGLGIILFSFVIIVSCLAGDCALCSLKRIKK